MAYFCHKCLNELEFDIKYGVKVGRQDTCPHCVSDLHCCKNCKLYDPGLHNQCKEPEAPFIRGREDGNFCPHFDFMDRREAPKPDDSAAKARVKLDALFKKK